MKNINLYYRTKYNNFGDVINPIIINKIFNINVYNNKPYHLIAIGSILDSFLRKRFLPLNYVKNYGRIINVWGSGFISKKIRNNEKFDYNLHFSAVRGNLTKERINKIYNNKFENIICGDPGLLINNLYPQKEKKIYTYGIIPHFIDKDLNIVNDLLVNLKNSTLIDIMSGPDNVIKKIKQCNFILSSCLHGLVASESFKIPSIWCKFSNNVLGNDYKFYDYYSVFKNKKIIKLDFTKSKNLFNEINDISEYQNFDFTELEAIKQSLISSFPFK